MENDELTSSDLPATSDPIWRSLGLIYSQTWFTRLWTLQEVVLAKQGNLIPLFTHFKWLMTGYHDSHSCAWNQAY